MLVEKSNHVILKCNVCTIEDMLHDGWCNLRCELRNIIRNKNKNEDLDVMLNVNSKKFKEIIMER